MNVQKGDKCKAALDFSDESSEDSFDIPPLINCQDDDFTTNDGILDPETGEIIEVSEAYQNTAHKDQAERGTEREDSLVTYGENIIDLPSTSKGEKSKNSEDIQISNNPLHSDEGPVLYYGHKKFRKIYKKEETNYNLVPNESIIDVSVVHQKGEEEEVTKLQVQLKKPAGADNSKR